MSWSSCSFCNLCHACFVGHTCSTLCRIDSVHGKENIHVQVGQNRDNLLSLYAELRQDSNSSSWYGTLTASFTGSQKGEHCWLHLTYYPLLLSIVALIYISNPSIRSKERMFLNSHSNKARISWNMCMSCISIMSDRYKKYCLTRWHMICVSLYSASSLLHTHCAKQLHVLEVYLHTIASAVLLQVSLFCRDMWWCQMACAWHCHHQTQSWWQAWHTCQHGSQCWGHQDYNPLSSGIMTLP